MRWTAERCRDALGLIARRVGAAVPDIRWPDVQAALERRLADREGFSVDEYLERLSTLPDDDPEWQALLPSIRVGETYFFRDPACFEALEQHVLAPLIAERRERGLLFLRIWSAGCATGEEPYSIAILLDRLLPDRSRWSLTLRATDIHRDTLEAARRGIYRAWALRATQPVLRDRYFEACGRDSHALRQEIRAMVTFAVHNLAAEAGQELESALAGWDLIVCRNVLMYFATEARRAAVEHLGRALRPGGWLVVAPAEGSAALMGPLSAVPLPGTVVYRKETAALSVGASGRLALPLLEEFPEAVGGAVVIPSLRPQGEDRPVGAEFPRSLGTSGAEARDDLVRARSLADRGALGEARQICEAALARDRCDLDAHLLLAAIADARGDEAGALEALRRAAYLDPDSALAHFLLGSLLLRRGQVGRARQSLETVVRVLASAAPGAPVQGAGDATAAEILERARECLALAVARDGHD